MPTLGQTLSEILVNIHWICISFEMPLVRAREFIPNHHLTLPVPPNLLDDLAAGKVSGYENYSAWFVDIGKDRVTIINQESGMDPLVALSKACKYRIIID